MQACNANVTSKSGLAHTAACTPPPPPPDPPPFPIQLRTSGDPNDMIGPSGAGTVHWVQGSQRLPYTYTAIFQNEATASAPAYQVLVTDKLDGTKLDLATVTLGPVRFGNHVVTPPAGVQVWSTRVDLRPAQNAFVDVAGALDPATGVLTWDLATVDASTGQPITDAINGFLPPDKGAPEGDGSVSFTVTPNSGAAERSTDHEPGDHRVRHQQADRHADVG